MFARILSAQGLPPTIEALPETAVRQMLKGTRKRKALVRTTDSI
jgi:hypothetical protein